MITFKCTVCGKQFSVGADMAGSNVTCTECESPLRVPDLEKKEEKAVPTVKSHSIAQPKPNSFLCTFEEAFAAGQKVIRNLGYKVDSLDKQNGLITFKTGASMKSWAGQEMSLMLIDDGDGSIEVSITGQRSQSGVIIQVFDFGEADLLPQKC